MSIAAMKIKFSVTMHVLYADYTWSEIWKTVEIDEEWIPDALNEYDHVEGDVEFERELQWLAEQVLWPDGLNGRIVYMHTYEPVNGWAQFSIEEDSDYYA